MKTYIIAQWDFEKIYLGFVKNGGLAEIFSDKRHFETAEDLGREELSEAIQKSGFRSDHIAVMIPDRFCLYKPLNCSKTSLREMELNLPYEFKEEIPNGEETNYDFGYVTLRENKKVLGIAVQRKKVQNLRNLLRAVGFRKVNLVPESIGYWTLIANRESSPYCCVLSLEPEEMALHFYDRDGFTAHHSFDKTFLESEKGKINELSEEILKVLDYYIENGFCEKETPLFLAGTQGFSKSLMTVLKEESGRKCVPLIRLFQRMPVSQESVALTGTLGAAMCSEKTGNFNGREKKKSHWVKRPLGGVLALAILFVILKLSCFDLISEKMDLEERYRTEQATLKEYKKLHKGNKKVLAAYEDYGFGYLKPEEKCLLDRERILQKVENTVGGNARVIRQEIIGNTVTLTLFRTDLGQSSEIMKALLRDPQVLRVEMNRANKDMEGNMDSGEMKIVFRDLE